MSNKKKVVILLATYRPNMVFFEKLLISLNQQDYSNLELYVRDDSADKEWSIKIEEMVLTTITKIPSYFEKNEINLGSNKTFEILTKDCLGDYLAYCDQDDIWEPYKISMLVDEIENKDAEMCYSDLSIINQDDVQTAVSFTKIKKRVVHKYGDNLFDYFLRRSSVTGCTMMVKISVAKKAIPFPSDFMVHDQWLTLFSASVGKIAYVSKPLIRYRIYEGNQIGAAILPEINSKQDYLQNRLLKELNKLVFLKKNYSFNYNHLQSINSNLLFLEKRIDFFKHSNLANITKMLVISKRDKNLIFFEIFIGIMPRKIVALLFDKLHKNKN
ncbi:glycosyltransferase [Lactococcus piscium]|nr:glycosyltransferase [Lactococcus paracarnosus]MCJ1993298.1 glycosyltransferase [Lactococcus paracarnosus]SPC37270.1 conserved hypothetical protein [Lactococcus piscium]